MHRRRRRSVPAVTGIDSYRGVPAVNRRIGTRTTPVPMESRGLADANPHQGSLVGTGAHQLGQAHSSASICRSARGAKRDGTRGLRRR